MSEQEQHDHLEFNDGLGDLLREKRPGRKGLHRSVWIAAGVVILVVLLFGVAFKWGTKILFKAKVATAHIAVPDSDASKVDTENKRLIHEMDALLAQASSNVSREDDVSSPAPVPSAKSVSHSSKSAVHHSKKSVPKIVHAAPISRPAPKSASVKKSSVPLPSKSVVARSPKRAPIVLKGALLKVVAGTFNSHGEAIEIETRLKKLGYPVYIKDQGSSWVLQVGAFRNTAVAEGMVADLQRKGFNASIVTP